MRSPKILLAVLALLLTSTACGNPSLTPEEFVEAVKNGDTEAVQRSVEAGRNPNYKTAQGSSVLEIAISQENLAMVELLLETGANPLADKSIFSAAYSRNLEIAKRLIDKGADPNQFDVDKEGNSPVLQAIMSGNIEIAKYLQQQGGKMNASSPTGDTAIISASCSGFAESVKLLLAAGANPNAANAHGETPLAMAQSNLCRDPASAAAAGIAWEPGHDAIAQMLKAAGAK